MTKPSILIAGIGNIFLGDDAFGSEVARGLQMRSWPADVHVEDFGIRGFDLVYALLDGHDLTVLIDAVPRGGSPGTLYQIEPDINELDELDRGSMIETHGMNPLRVLAMVKSMGGKLEKILLVGCEPSPLLSEQGEMGLSEPVQGAVIEAQRMVESIVNEHLYGLKQLAVSNS